MSQSILEPNALQHQTRQQYRQIRRNILLLAFPVIAEMGLATLADITNMVMVGHLGVQSMNAIGITMQPLMLALVIFNGLSVATTALIARFFGEKNQELANRTFQQSLAASFLLALLLGVIIYQIAPWILQAMGETDTETIRLGANYIHWMIPGLIAYWLNFVIFASLRGAGDTLTPAITNVLIYLINVTGNYFLIFGHWIFPELGVNGAGIASSLARLTGLALMLLAIRRRGSRLSIKWQEFFHFDLQLLTRIVKIGLPAAAEQLFLRFGQTWYTKVVKGLGPVAFAAHTTAINAESLSYMPGWGFSVAATTMVGQKLGEGNPEEAEASANIALKFACTIMGLMAIAFLIFPEALIGLYVQGNDPNAAEFVRLGARNMRIVAIAQLPQAVQFVLAGALRGAGYTKKVLYSTAIGVWFGRLFCAYIFVVHFGWGLVGAWAAMCLDWFLRSSYVFFLWRKGQWKHTEV